MEQPGERVRVILRQLANVEQPVIHIAIIGHQMRTDELELTLGETGKHLALRTDDLPEMQHFLLNLNDSVQQLWRRMLDDFLLQLGNLKRQFIEGRLVVLHDAVQQRVRHAIRRARNVDRALQATLLRLLHAAQRHFMEGHQEILPEKEVQFLRREHAILPAVVHRMDHHEQVRGELVLVLRHILLDLWRWAHRDAVLDRQLVEVKNVLQHQFGLLRRRLLQIEPQEEIGIRQQRRHEKSLNVLAVQLALSCERE